MSPESITFRASSLHPVAFGDIVTVSFVGGERQEYVVASIGRGMTPEAESYYEVTALRTGEPEKVALEIRNALSDALNPAIPCE